MAKRWLLQPESSWLPSIYFYILIDMFLSQSARNDKGTWCAPLSKLFKECIKSLQRLSWPLPNLIWSTLFQITIHNSWNMVHVMNIQFLGGWEMGIKSKNECWMMKLSVKVWIQPLKIIVIIHIYIYNVTQFCIYIPTTWTIVKDCLSFICRTSLSCCEGHSFMSTFRAFLIDLGLKNTCITLGSVFNFKFKTQIIFNLTMGPTSSFSSTGFWTSAFGLYVLKIFFEYISIPSNSERKSRSLITKV